MTNTFIRDFFNDHTNQWKADEGAVFVEGAWGVGKTTFLKATLPKEAIFISLAGKDSRENVLEEIYFRCSPNKSFFYRMFSKAQDVGPKISKYAAVLQFIPISVRLTSEDVQEKIIVLDDFARSVMDSSELVGLVIYLTETLRAKVILSADIEKLPEDFLPLREKVIFRSFKISPPTSHVFDEIVKEKRNVEKLGDLVADAKSDILRIFSRADTSSLRVLKRSLRSSFRLLSSAATREGVHDSILIEAFKQVFLFGLIKYSGESDLGFLHVSESSDDHSDGKYDLSQKFGSEVYISHVSDGTMRSAFVDGDFLPEVVSDELYLQSRKAIGEKIGYVQWRVISSHDTVSDEEILRAIYDVEVLMSNNEIIDAGVIAHLASVFMLMYRIGLYDANYEEIVEKFGTYIDGICGSDDLRGGGALRGSVQRGTGWGGWSFYVLDEYREHFAEVISKIVDSSRGQEAIGSSKDICDLLDRSKTAREFVSGIDGLSKKHNKANGDLLLLVDPREFVEWLMSLSREELGKIFAQENFELNSWKSGDDLNVWRDEVLECLRQLHQDADGSSKYTMERFSRFILKKEI